MTRRVVMLTGPPGVGKTTAIRKISQLLRRSGVPIRGFYTEEVRHGGQRIGFDVVTLESDENPIRKCLARKGPGSTGPKVGAYCVHVEEFESTALPILNSAKTGETLIVDEVGKMELLSAKFLQSMEAVVFDGNIVVVCTVPLKSSHAFVTRMKQMDGGVVITVDKENRDSVPDTVVQMLK